ncbi:hypothetical protein ACQY0O_005668 [Thecaphora frezii]
MADASDHRSHDADANPGLGRRALHEVVKLVIGQTPKGGHTQHLMHSANTNTNANADSEKEGAAVQPSQPHPPCTPRRDDEFDEEVRENAKRFNRFGGDDPMDPEEERRYIQERIQRHHHNQGSEHAYATDVRPSGVASDASTMVDHHGGDRRSKRDSAAASPADARSHMGASSTEQSNGNGNGNGSGYGDASDASNGGYSNNGNGDDYGDSEKITPDPNEVGWDGPDDPENPQNWSQTHKWAYTILVAVLTVNVTYASSAPSTSTQQLAMEFRIGTVTATLITTLFLLGYCLGPIVWSSASELYGRKTIFVGSMLVYTLFILGQALAKGPATLFVTRFLSGVFASAPLTNSGGLIADLWDPVGRGFAMAVFSASVFFGPVLGPIIGSFVTQSFLGWRWVFWLMMIFAGAVWLLTLVLLPETFAPVLLVRKAKRLRRLDPVANANLYAPHERTDWSLGGVVHRTVYRPFQILVQETMLVAITVYLSVVYGLLYMLFEAVPVVFSELRGLNLGESGLIFIAVGVGTTMGACISIVQSLKYRQLVPFWKGCPPPEERLSGAILAGPLLVVGCFWFGWTGNYPAVPWYVPALSLVVIGMSFTLVFISLLAYIVDCYLMFAASALAANTIVRSVVGAALPLVTRQFFNNVGTNWAASIIGFVGLILMPVPLLFYWYGSRIRGRSNFAPALDLKIRKQLEDEGKLPKDSLRSWKAEGLNGLPQAKEEYRRRHEGSGKEAA